MSAEVAVAFGLVFLAAGYSFAFTDVGAWMVFAGAGMLATGVLLCMPLPTAVGALAGPLIAIALLLLLYLDRRGDRPRTFAAPPRRV